MLLHIISSSVNMVLSLLSIPILIPTPHFAFALFQTGWIVPAFGSHTDKQWTHQQDGAKHCSHPKGNLWRIGAPLSGTQRQGNVDDVRKKDYGRTWYQYQRKTAEREKEEPQHDSTHLPKAPSLQEGWNGEGEKDKETLNSWIHCQQCNRLDTIQDRITTVITLLKP